ncbi:PQQ-binding-like beta-propeller repeat protein [Luteitalea sp.]|uniref:outer membrane protein assembly factor BamB family protein n=1 Tax=Luteitalea sp. TaxID=2004800 RepID=UPI0025B86801|nr:PQQ-binding-like beta-propeller repeat protein [Luteitalea sp.]
MTSIRAVTAAVVGIVLSHALCLSIAPVEAQTVVPEAGLQGWPMAGNNPWRTAATPVSGPSSLPTFVSMAATQGLRVRREDPQGRVYLTSEQLGILSVHGPAGTLLWVKNIPEVSDVAIDASRQRVYASTNSGALWAFNAADGGAVWAQPVNLGSSGYRHDLSVLSDGTVLVALHGTYVGTGGRAAVAATGEVRWSSEQQQSRIVVDRSEQVMYMMRSKWSGGSLIGDVVRIRVADGADLGGTPCDPRGEIFSSYHDVVYTSEYDGGLMRLRDGLQSCDVIPTEKPVLNASIAGSGQIVLELNDKTQSLAADGSPLWVFNARLGGPILAASERLYGVVAGTGALVALNLANGAELWRHTFAKPITGHLLTHDGALLVSTEDGVFRGETASPPPSAVVLTFDDLQTGEAVGNFYNGGFGGIGTGPGPSWGITFVGDEGGNPRAVGTFAGVAPLGKNALQYSTGFTINLRDGFEHGLAFSAIGGLVGFGVQVYDGVDASGNLLGAVSVPASAGTAQYLPYRLPFIGRARSIRFNDGVGYAALDHLELGVAAPQVPSITALTPPVPPVVLADTQLSVTGSGFITGLSVLVDLPGGGGATLVGTQISATTSNSLTMLATLADAGPYTIRVRNPDGGTSEPFTFVASSGVRPVSAGISPEVGAQVTTQFVVSGTGFTPNGKIRRFVRQVGAAHWSEIGPVVGDGAGRTIWAYRPDCGHTPGPSMLVMVDEESQTSSSSLAFTVSPAAACESLKITSISPTSAVRGQATTFTLQGIGFGADLRAELVSKSGAFPILGLEVLGTGELRLHTYIGGGGTEDMRIRVMRSGGVSDSRWVRAQAGGSSGSITLAAARSSVAPGQSITLTARMAYGNGDPIPNALVRFRSSEGNVLIAAAMTGSDGVATSSYRSGVPLATDVLAWHGDLESVPLRLAWVTPDGVTDGHLDPLGEPHVGFLSEVEVPVVFVHGITSDACTWVETMSALASPNRPVDVYGGDAGLNRPVPCDGVGAGGLIPWALRSGSTYAFYTVTFTDNKIGSGLKAWGTELGEQLRRIAAARGGGVQRLILVGHSAGGLAARSYLQSTQYTADRMAGALEVVGLVTYGTPHQGTPIAQKICELLEEVPCALSQGAEDMKPGSTFLNQLNLASFLPRGLAYVSLVGSTDRCGWDHWGDLVEWADAVLDDPNDCIVPFDSQDMSRVPAAVTVKGVVRVQEYSHIEETKDVNGLLAALHTVGVKGNGLVLVSVRSPVDVVVTDPAGRSVGKTGGTIPWATYDEYVGEDGERHDEVIIPLGLPGEYKVEVVPHIDAVPGQTYSITSQVGGVQRELARSVPVETAPSSGYTFSNSVKGYLAEGATSAFFDTRLALLNPTNAATDAKVTFLPGAGSPIVHTVRVPARTRATVWPKAIDGLASAEFSTVVESEQPLVVDRTMTWDTSGYGAHAETAVAAPATVWYLAEGATHSGFNLFYLLQNPATTATSVRVRYLRGVGTPLEKTYILPPTSRTNIWVNVEEFPGAGRALESADLSAVIESLDSTPIIVERAMYLSSQNRTFNAGHASMAVNAPATQWFLAEGATGAFFDLFVLIANPTSSDANVTVTYLLGDGTTYTRPLVAPANSRSTIWVDMEEIPGVPGRPLADVAVSTTVIATNGVPIVVERAMWWPGGGTWHEAHNSAGSTETGTEWALAEGEVGGTGATETYILIANTSAFAGIATVTLLFEDGTSANREYALPPRSRTNVPVKQDFESAAGRRFGAIVTSTGTIPAQVVVERAMYSNADGVQWAAGTNALATRLR